MYLFVTQHAPFSSLKAGRFMLFRKKWMMRESHRVCKQRCLLAECVLRMLDWLTRSQSDTGKGSSFLKCDAASLGDNVQTFERL